LHAKSRKGLQIDTPCDQVKVPAFDESGSGDEDYSLEDSFDSKVAAEYEAKDVNQVFEDTT
jgi:hypothetical protein